MKVCTYGLWHLGSVISACLAEAGHEVRALDPDAARVAGLRLGRPPIAEPGLPELVAAGLASGRLSFTTDAAAALAGAEVLWVTFDTPVDDEDRADTAWVCERVRELFPLLSGLRVVLVSSQLPAGTMARLEAEYRRVKPSGGPVFACSPENLRLGKAIEIFKRPDRLVVGVPAEGRPALEELFRPFGFPVEWMGVASAEMTKHAINSFLALSVSFINEVAVLCERTGADAREVERGLKSEMRIGPRAYLRAGGAFAGGTLARDVVYLTGMARGNNLACPLLGAVLESNRDHQDWPVRRLAERVPDLKGARVGVLGLAYKPGTSTTRRSPSLGVCRWLLGRGAVVQAYDPQADDLPADIAGHAGFRRVADASEAAAGALALVVLTEWPEYRNLDAATVLARMAAPLVLDANRFLEKALDGRTGITYLTVGRP